MKYFWVIVGFLSLIIGIISLILHSLGLQFTWLSPINNLSALLRFIVHLFMIFGGVVIVYLNTVDWKKDETYENHASGQV